jgi:hypothetical protein
MTPAGAGRDNYSGSSLLRVQSSPKESLGQPGQLLQVIGSLVIRITIPVLCIYSMLPSTIIKIIFSSVTIGTVYFFLKTKYITINTSETFSYRTLSHG